MLAGLGLDKPHLRLEGGLWACRRVRSAPAFGYTPAQALRLWLKGTPVHDHPSKLENTA